MAPTYVSLFTGVGGFDLGFDAAGFRCLAQVEIDRQCRSVLALRWSDVPRYDDVRGFGCAQVPACDVLVGGFPCQDLSIAGNRGGLGGKRSGLFYELVRVARELRPQFLVWENVCGLLSSDDGRDLARVLRHLADGGFSGGYRVLDARYFGVPQSRRRVFGVFARGRAGADRCAEILALAAGVPGHHQTSGEAEAEVARGLGGGTPGRGWSDDLERAGAFVVGQCHGSNVGPVGTVRSGNGGITGGVPFVAFGGNDTRGERRVAAALSAKGGTGRQDFETETFIVNSATSCATAEHARPSPVARSLDTTGSFASGQGGTLAVFNPQAAGNQTTLGFRDDLTGALGASQVSAVVGSGVRRLTPRECERLMGWPDDHTRYCLRPRKGKKPHRNSVGTVERGGQLFDVCEVADGPRYRMCGNGVVGTVAAWLAARLRRVIDRETLAKPA